MNDGCAVYEDGGFDPMSGTTNDPIIKDLERQLSERVKKLQEEEKKRLLQLAEAELSVLQRLHVIRHQAYQLQEAFAGKPTGRSPEISTMLRGILDRIMQIENELGGTHGQRGKVGTEEWPASGGIPEGVSEGVGR
jgi:hypothetical protein